MIDTTYRVETPEGVDLQAHLAGAVPRVLAYAIDLSLRAAALAFALFLFSLFDWATGVLLVVAFLVEWFYPVVFEVLNNGQTPGKKIMQISVVNDNLTPISWGPSTIRNLLRSVDILPMFYFSGLLSIILTEHFQRLGDLAAGTLVVYQKIESKQLELPATPAVAPTEPLPLDEQLAIINFTERSNQLSQSRKEELANILQPLHKLSGAQAVNQLHGIGRWLLGDKD